MRTIPRRHHQEGAAQPLNRPALLTRRGWVFDDDTGDWALCFEEDIVLVPRYLEVMNGLIAHVDAEPGIVQVSATGDTVAPGSRLFDFGLCPIGSSQDCVKQAIRKHLGRLAVATACSYGRHIGVEGEHFTPEVFAKHGYDNPPDLAGEPPEFVGDVSAIVPELLREDQRAWASELDAAWKSRLQHASAEDESRATDAESRLADAVAFAAWAEDRASAVRARLMYVEALLDVPERRVQSVLNRRSWRLTTCLRILGGGLRTIAAKFRRDA